MPACASCAATSCAGTSCDGTGPPTPASEPASVATVCGGAPPGCTGADMASTGPPLLDVGGTDMA
eukprot:2478410-Prymnesium_polylepis.1